MSENMRLVTESRWLELLKIERQLERLRAAIPKRITSWGQAWVEGETLPLHSPVDGWNACVDAFEKALAGENRASGDICDCGHPKASHTTAGCRHNTHGNECWCMCGEFKQKGASDDK